MTLLGGYLLSPHSFAGEIDVYGASPELGLKMIQKYGSSLAHLEEKRIYKVMHHQKSENLEKAITEKIKIIQHEFSLPALRVDTVFYPDIGKFYTTMGCCQLSANDAYTPVPYPQHKKLDIIDSMHFFIQEAVSFMISHPEYANRLVCRDYQCITPEIPEFNAKLKYFRKVVPQSKAWIEKTIFEDKNLERRRAAIFLLAYYPNPEEINQILTRLLDDKNHFIRHDALRVYGEMYPKTKHMDIPVQKILLSAHACDVGERNKALIVLSEAAKKSQYHSLLKQDTKQFIELLKLKQPNNHVFAYDILKQISHKKYLSTDIASWEHWAQSKH